MENKLAILDKAAPAKVGGDRERGRERKREGKRLPNHIEIHIQSDGLFFYFLASAVVGTMLQYIAASFSSSYMIKPTMLRASTIPFITHFVSISLDPHA